MSFVKPGFNPLAKRGQLSAAQIRKKIAPRRITLPDPVVEADVASTQPPVVDAADVPPPVRVGVKKRK